MKKATAIRLLLVLIIAAIGSVRITHRKQSIAAIKVYIPRECQPHDFFDNHNRSLSIVLHSNHTATLSGTTFPAASLPSIMQRVIETRSEPSVVLTADAQSSYGSVATLVGALKQLNPTLAILLVTPEQIHGSRCLGLDPKIISEFPAQSTD